MGSGREKSTDGPLAAQPAHARVRLRSTHTNARLETTMQGVGGHRVEVSTRQDAHLPETRAPFEVGGKDPSHHVTVTAEKLGTRVKHDRCAVSSRLLEYRRRKGGVDHHRDATCCRDDGLDVDQL